MLLPALAAAAGRRQGRSAASRLAAMAMCGERAANADAAAAAAASNAPNAAAAAAIDEIRRRFSSSSSASSPSSSSPSPSPSDLLRRFADPQLQPPSIVRLPPALQEAHDFVSSSAVAGGPRRLGPLAASLAGRLASRSRSLGRGGASAAAWEEEEEEGEEEEEEEEEDELEGYDEFDRDGDGGDEAHHHLPLSLEEGGSVLVLDLVAGGTARVSADKGTPLGRADEEALGWRGGRRRRKSEKKKKKRGPFFGEGEDSSLPSERRPAPPAYPDDATAAAYALARAPASFAATLHALLALRAASPSFSSSSFSSSSGRRRRPLRVLDFGAGTGAAFLAAAAAFGGRSVSEVVAVERSRAMADAGRRVVAHLREAAADADGTAGEEELESSEDDVDDGSESEESEGGEEQLPPFSPPRRVRWVRSLEEAEDEHSSSSFAAEGVTDHYWRAKREAAAAAAKKMKEDEASSSASLSKPRFDLVLASFSLGESPDAASERLAVERLWELVAPGGALVVVEPGTPAGSLAVRAARDRVLSLSLSLSSRQEEEGGEDGSPKPSHVAAPCLHDGACPLAASDRDGRKRTWCHFGQRLERSRAQRVAAASAAAASGRLGAGGGGGAAAPDAAASDLGATPLSRPAFSVSVSSHTDVRFSYVALVAAPRRPGRRVSRRQQARAGAGGGRGGGEEPSSSPPFSLEPSSEQTVLARVTRAPRPRSGHVLVGACFDSESLGLSSSFSVFPSRGKSSSASSSAQQLDLDEGWKASSPSSSFGASVVTVTSSSRPKGTYRAARGARWGGVVALPASAVAKAAALDARKATTKNKS